MNDMLNGLKTTQLHCNQERKNINRSDLTVSEYLIENDMEYLVKSDKS